MCVYCACTDRNREAWLCHVACLVAVDSVVERTDDGDVRGEREVMVVPLAKDGHQVCVERVAYNIVIRGAEDSVGYLPDLVRGS